MKEQVEKRIKELTNEYEKNSKTLEDINRQIDIFYAKRNELQEKNHQLAGGFAELDGFLKKLMEEQESIPEDTREASD